MWGDKWKGGEKKKRRYGGEIKEGRKGSLAWERNHKGDDTK